MHLKLGDEVQVLAGVHRSERGRIKAVDREKGKVIVEGVNLVRKHVRPDRRNTGGGRLSREMPIPMSNVMLVCPSCGKPSRTGARFTKDGAKERFCKKCGAGTAELSPPKAKYATAE